MLLPPAAPNGQILKPAIVVGLQEGTQTGFGLIMPIDDSKTIVKSKEYVASHVGELPESITFNPVV